MITRAHTLYMKGYEWAHNDKLLSIYSAPNSKYRCGNQAAIVEVDEFMTKKLLQFGPARDPHKGWIPRPDCGINMPDLEGTSLRVPDYFL